MKISDLSVRRPVLMTMIYIVLLVMTVVFVSDLEIALYPSVDMPMATIFVDCNDAGPEEIEQQVTKALENAVNSLENLVEVSSESSSGRAIVSLEFEYGTNLDDAVDDMETAIEQVSNNLPDWAETPSVFRMDMIMSSSFMKLVIGGPKTLIELKQIAENTVSPLLYRIDGLSQVEVRGIGDRTYTVSVDPIRLASYNLTLTTVSNALAARNVQGSGGTLTQDNTDYTVTIDERFASLDDIRNTVVSTIDNANILISDIATVDETVETSFQESYLDGSQVVSLELSNDSDSNAATVALAVRAQLDSINAQLPDDVKLSVYEDSSTMISDTMNEVYTSAFEGVVLAALIIFLFLRSFKPTLIISLSMPISIAFTLMIMSIAGITVNSMSMSGLILGIGMVVDASIIILENTYKLREKGYSAVASAILGSRNMINAIFASTLTTICVFLPLIIYKNQLEMVGVMFQDLIITVCIALFASLFVSITLVPALCGSILKINTRVQKPLRFKSVRWLDQQFAGFETRLENGYAKVLDYFLNHRLILIVLLVLLLLFSLQHFSGIGISLTPQMNTDDSITLDLTLPAGTNKSVTRTELFNLQATLMEKLPQEAYTQMFVSVGSTNTGSLEIGLPSLTEQTYSASEVKNLIRPLLNSNPSANWIFGAGRGPGSSSAINVSVTSNDTKAMKEVVESIAAIIATYVPEASNVATDLEDGSPKINIIVDKSLANDLGVSMDTIDTVVTYALAGDTATSISTFDSDNTYDLLVMMSSDSLQTIDDLGSLLVTASDGSMIRLDSLATFEQASGPVTITRENLQRVNNVTANLMEGYSSSEVQERVNQALDDYLLIPEGVTVTQTGEMQQFTSYYSTLVLIIVLALLLVFAVMAAQFESLIDPFIIFATIPLLLIGVVFIHLAMNQDFSLFSIVGIVALIGVVVNNGIVLIDMINQLVRKKTPVHEACLIAAKDRLRPILMTTLTTVLGMIPLAFFPGEGAEMMQPIAVTFVGGLLTGSFLTLFLSPVLYATFNKHREKNFNNPNTLNNQLEAFDLEGK
ncbi:MAG: efflux RND transporter permease subunit [Sphaerochaetaceae bacterium]